MIRLFSLRRIIRAIERLADAADLANEIARQRLSLDYPGLTGDQRPRRPVSISAPTIDDWQKRTDADRAAREAGL